MQEVHGFQDLIYSTKFTMSFLLSSFITLLTPIVTQCHVLPVPRPRLLVSLLTWIRHAQRQGQKQSGGQKQGKQSNKWTWSER